MPLQNKLEDAVTGQCWIETKDYWNEPLEFPTRDIMEFRLAYTGGLLKAGKGGHVWEKHQLRRYFHSQLENLWKAHPLLMFYGLPYHADRLGHRLAMQEHDGTKIENIAAHFEGYVPLVTADYGMCCELDILLLRSLPPGHIIQRGGNSGGDLDNRIAQLVDSLCMPVRGQVRLREGDSPDPRPMFVLLQDDSLITSLKVESDRFLGMQNENDPAECVAIVTVRVKAADPTKLPYGISL